jgi:hypothetical protein
MASIINAATSGGLITTADTSGILNIQTAGTTAITVTAAQNVGIATSSPPVTLSVAGTIGVFGGSLNGSIGSPQLYRPASDTLAIATGAVERMRIDASGNLGIGTSSPDYQLDVSGTSTSTTTLGVGISVENGSFTTNTRAGIVFRNGDNYGASVWSPRTGSAAGALVFGTNNAGGTAETNIVERARIDSSGRLLVGLTSSIAGAGQFAIDQAGGGTPIMNLIGTQGVGGGGRPVGLIFTGVSNDTGPVYTSFARISAAKENATQGNTAGYLDFATTPAGGSLTSRVVIDSSGNFLVGVTSGSYHTLAKDIAGNFATEIRNSNANPYGLYIRHSGVAPNNSVNEFLYCGDTVGQKMSVRSNGGIANYSASNYNLASDLRLKHNIEPVKSYWEVFKTIEWKSWLYNDQTDEIKNIGVIAQELQVLAPEFVCESNLKETPEGELPYLGLWENDLKMAGMSVITELVKRCEQQQALITQLQADVAALKGA